MNGKNATTTMIMTSKWRLKTIDLVRWSHGALDIETLHILPFLLQQRHHEVHGHIHIGDNLIFGHSNIGDGCAHTHWTILLNTKVELDSGRNLVHLKYGDGDGVAWKEMALMQSDRHDLKMVMEMAKVTRCGDGDGRVK